MVKCFDCDRDAEVDIYYPDDDLLVLRTNDDGSQITSEHQAYCHPCGWRIAERRKVVGIPR